MEIDPTNRNPAEIIENPLCEHSSWHFFQALSWLDLAKRTQKPGPLHYAAFELRYGIEYLLFELLCLNNGGVSETDYKRCIGNPSAMKKLLRANDNRYERLLSFTRILMELGGWTTIKLRYWKLNELFKYLGKASEMLHFAGIHSLTYNDMTWFVKALSRLEEMANALWQCTISTVGIGLLKPDLMEPEVFQAWEEYNRGTLGEEDLKARMNLIQPILKDRPRKTLYLTDSHQLARAACIP